MRRLNYVSLATIFVAIIPLNGFLLQEALSNPVHTLKNTEFIPIPMVKRLQQGYSGRTALGGDGVDASQPVWPTVFQQVQNAGGSSYSQYAYFGNYDYSSKADVTPILNKGLYHDAHSENQAVWQATVPGAGFDYSCTKFTVAFDMFPHNDSQTYNGTMFDLRLLWDKADPNKMYLNSYWKDKKSCQGPYQVRNCTISAATVLYPVQVQLTSPAPSLARTISSTCLAGGRMSLMISLSIRRSLTFSPISTRWLQVSMPTMGTFT